MKREELREFILRSFDFVKCEKNESQRIEIFRVDLEKLSQFAQEKLKTDDDLGDFERETFKKQIDNFEQAEDKMPIFAILHESEFPVQFELKTGVALAKLLREKESVVPSKLMSEREWNKIIGFGQVSKSEAEDLLRLSFRMVTE